VITPLEDIEASPAGVGGMAALRWLSSSIAAKLSSAALKM
jgi:hypothetical protein